MTRHAPPLVALPLLVVCALGQEPSARPPTVTVTVHAAVERVVPVVRPQQAVPWQLVTNLTREDFEVLVDAEPCPIASFSTDDGPVALVVLLDVSNSAGVPPGWLLEPVEKSLIPALQPGDRVSFGRFGGTDTRLGRFAGVPREMLREARDALALPRGMTTFGLGASPAWDAVDGGLTALESEPARRAILLVTDGRSTGNVHGLSETIRRAVVADVAVDIVGEAQPVVAGLTDPTSAPPMRPDVFIRPMADTTGGAYADLFGPEVQRPDRVDEAAVKRWLGGLLAHLVDDLHHTYTLSCVPRVLDGGVHRLEVRVKKPGLKARARQRYIAPGGDR